MIRRPGHAGTWDPPPEVVTDGRDSADKGSPRCNAAQNTCTFSLIMCLKNLATNTLIPTVLRPLQEPAEPHLRPEPTAHN